MPLPDTIDQPDQYHPKCGSECIVYIFHLDTEVERERIFHSKAFAKGHELQCIVVVEIQQPFVGVQSSAFLLLINPADLIRPGLLLPAPRA
jgi:hypothetical protein